MLVDTPMDMCVDVQDVCTPTDIITYLCMATQIDTYLCVDYIVMACIVVVYTVMAYIVMAVDGSCRFENIAKD